MFPTPAGRPPGNESEAGAVKAFACCAVAGWVMTAVSIAAVKHKTMFGQSGRVNQRFYGRGDGRDE